MERAAQMQLLIRWAMGIRRISAKALAKYREQHGGHLPFSSITGARKPVRKVSAKQRGKWKTRKALRIRWWAEGNRTCGICDHGIREFGEMVPDHIEPGSGKSEDESNLQPAHGICNLLKGSRRNFKLTMNPCPCGFRN